MLFLVSLLLLAFLRTVAYHLLLAFLGIIGFLVVGVPVVASIPFVVGVAPAVVSIPYVAGIRGPCGCLYCG